MLTIYKQNPFYNLISGPYFFNLDTRVRLEKLDKKNKRAQITEHFYVEKNFM